MQSVEIALRDREKKACTMLCGVLWKSSMALAFFVAAVFIAFPSIDLAVSRVFYLGDGRFIGQYFMPFQLLRSSFSWLFAISCGLVVAGIASAWSGKRVWLGLRRAQWIFLGLCLSIGPGLVANAMLKDHWGRARPVQVVEFGGNKAFTSPLTPSDQCARNCSFVAGEPSAMFAVFFAIALVVPQWSPGLVLAGVFAGLIGGLIRIAQGGHFLSDVLFAGVFMALTVAALFALLFRIRWPRFRFEFATVGAVELFITSALVAGFGLVLAGILYWRLRHPEWTSADILMRLWPCFSFGVLAVLAGWLYEKKMWAALDRSPPREHGKRSCSRSR